MKRSSAASAFVGGDRRRAPDPAGPGRVFVVGAAAVLATAVTLAVVALSAPPMDPDQARDVVLVLDAVSVVVAAGVFVSCLARWRLVGESAPLWIGTAALVFGAVRLGVPNLVGVLVLGRLDVGSGLWAAGRAGLVVTLALLGGGVLAPTVDTRLTARRLIGATATAVGVLAGVFAAWPAVGRALTVAGVDGPDVPAALVAWLVVAAWLAVASTFVLKGLRRSWMYAWCGVLSFALLLAQLADTAAAATPDRWAVAAAALRAIGFAAAAAGCALELGRAYAEQRSRLFDSELTLEAAAVQERLEAASRRAQRHDVRNAVLAIEGAAVTLERHRDRLGPADRASLTGVLSTGVERLQRLLEDGRPPATVDLAELAGSVVAGMAWNDRVDVDVPPGLVGSGSETQTAEVVRLLLDNADRRAPGGRITLKGRTDGDWVVLQVADRGPGMSRQGRRSLQARFDSSAAGGGQIGLLVAGRLMHGQGGDLWVEGSSTGGAFALCLPRAGVQDGPQHAGAGGS